MTDADRPRRRRFRSPVRLVECASLSSLIVAAGVASASAYTILRAAFSPGHGSMWERVKVGELPLAVDCPTVHVWLAPRVARSPANWDTRRSPLTQQSPERTRSRRHHPRDAERCSAVWAIRDRLVCGG